MAKSTVAVKLNPTNETEQAVQEATTTLLEEQAVIDQLNELRAAINELNDSVINMSSMLGDHEARLLHLGDSAKPIPKTIYGDIDLGMLFGQTVAQIVAGFLQQFPHSKGSMEALRDYSRTGITAATIVLEEILKRKEDSHRS